MLQEYKTDIPTGLGLPPWANHIAFNSPDRDDLDMRLKRWLDNGLDAVRIDHDWCISIYADDPNGITVEFCMSTREFTDEDRAAAEALRAASVPELNRAEPPIEFFTATANA
jgi:catechol-2,3-dioxygenase